MKYSREQSDAYMAGWGCRHKRGTIIDNPHQKLSEQHDYWQKGWQDCNAGRIDAPIALGPEFIEPKK